MTAAGPLDALARHLAMWSRLDPARDAPAPARDAFAAHDAAAPAPDAARAAHARYARERDGPAHATRGAPDPTRVARYLRALDRVCAAARHGDALCPALLASVQGVVLGLPDARPAPLRAADAFARGGAHVYPARADLAALWAARLRAWEHSPAHPAARAAGVYLDVIFLHPYADGNARAARLASHFVLARAGRAVPEYAAVVALPKAPGDDAGYWRLARAIALGGAAHARRDTACPDRVR